ncbi:DUF6078 family protein [Bacteroides sp. AN502(2024)]|uniref:DUF6078 family protein n=1 Tax=Bacteroides sp. AN502(2024) TaxID=3160599 RepID=UPI0035176131
MFIIPKAICPFPKLSNRYGTTKNQMLGYFERGMYYRFYRKEKYLSSGQQEYIRRIFRQNGITEEHAFDSYTEEYK